MKGRISENLEREGGEKSNAKRRETNRNRNGKKTNRNKTK